MVIGLWIIIGILIFGFGAIIVSRYYMNKQRKITEIPKSIQDEFVEVKSFNEDKYIEDNFDIVFHSIKMDDWIKEISSDEITFSKNPNLRTGNSWNSVRLKVSYKIKDGKFTIDYIGLTSGNVFTYKGKLKEEDYKFFYKQYYDYKTESNRKAKESCDESMKRLHAVVGKASIRDSKIDDILNR